MLKDAERYAYLIRLCHNVARCGLTVLSLLLISCEVRADDEATDPTASTKSVSPQQLDFFERRIRPLLSARCYSCHSQRAKTVHGGLRLDSAEAIRSGGDSGTLLVAGHPEKSLLIEVIQYDGDIQMPPKGKLDDQEIALLTKWVESGAVFPSSVQSPAMEDGGIDIEKGRQFWSFLPAVPKELPTAKQADWPRRRLDHFLLSAMEQRGLAPSPEADRAVLARRLSFDLVGLPPSPQDVAGLVADQSPDALNHYIERLLQSPQFGERWARFWLDLARYTDRTASWLDSTGEAHLYRDWVVRAMNDDISYDEFIRRQLATDMMSETGPDDLPALGFIGLSPNYWKELKLPAEIIKVIVADEWEERVDVVSRTFLGLTVACARCHDHKFDPITSEDYYALAGVFASCRIGGRPTIAEELYEPVKQAKQQVADLEKKLAALRKKKPLPEDEIAGVTKEISDIKSRTPNFDTPIATALLEESLYVLRAGKRADQGTKLDYREGARDLNLFIRGNPNRLGPIVPRRFPAVLSNANAEPFQNGSGRLELAESITRDAASLAARVIVNRIWSVYFNTGLVRTPSNFGELGERPSHPDLLDDLAANFMANDWSMKWLHREIVHSATYRQLSTISEQGLQVDPDNRLLSRMNRRRLDFEQWRDAMLACSGSLDLKQGGPSTELAARDNVRRTIYCTIHRREMSDVLLNHDFPAPTSHSPTRARTTTALQGLYALNGPLVQAQADALATRLTSDESSDADRIKAAYRLLFTREPTASETELGLAFLGTAEGEDRELAWQQYAHVLLASNEFLYLD